MSIKWTEVHDDKVTQTKTFKGEISLADLFGMCAQYPHVIDGGQIGESLFENLAVHKVDWFTIDEFELKTNLEQIIVFETQVAYH